MGTPEFPDLGRHCSFHDCNLLDFLPFTCDECHQVFCIDHRSYSKHQCPNAKANDVTVLVCPICAKGVRLIPNEDPNLTWDYHVKTNCDPSNYAKVHKKPKCPVRGCREYLAPSNKMVCRDCKQEVCLKHRFGPDHNCPGQLKMNSKDPSFAGRFVQSFRQRASIIGSGQTSNLSAGAVQAGWQSAASTIRASAEAGMTKFNTLTTGMLNVVGGIANKGQLEKETLQGQVSKATKPPPPESKEVCPQCGKQFSNVSVLIQHVERSHSTGKTGFGQKVVDLCPKCGRGFQDPVSLVRHVEKDHGGTSTDYSGK